MLTVEYNAILLLFNSRLNKKKIGGGVMIKNNKNTDFNLLQIVLFIIICLLSFMQLNACDIDFSIEKNKKPFYSIGEEIIVCVTVALTHRNCPVDINKTDFKTDGIQILAMTPWKEISTGTYERKLKLKVIGNKSGYIVIKAIRTCEKEGGKATLTLKAEVIK